jgi:hypothetical protein
MQTKEPTRTQGISIMAEVPIPTTLEQEIPILVVMLVHLRHMLINMASIKPVLQTLTRTKSTLTLTQTTRVIQPAQAYNPPKSTDIDTYTSRIRTMTMTIMDPKLSYKQQ